MSNDTASRTKPTTGHGGLLLVALFVLMLVGLVVAFLVVVEQPRRARNASIELVRTKFHGDVETVSNCPEWLVGTFAEDYFTYVVAVRVAHGEPVTRGDTGYLAPLGDLDVLEVTLPEGTNGVIASLPYSRDLFELNLANVTDLPDPADVPNLTDLSLANPAWNPGDAAVLARYENLERVRLQIHDSAVASAAIEAVSRLPHLSELRLEYSHVPDAALDHLANAKSLLLLDLSRTGVTGDGVRRLARLTSLQHLELDNNVIWFHGRENRSVVPLNQIGNDDTRHLVPLQDLRFLQLDRTNVGDAGLEHVAELPILQYLYLEESPVGIDGVRYLAKLKYLKRLNLRKNWYAKAVLDDDAVDDLVQLTDLEVLNVQYSDISREGLARLRLELPRTDVQPHSPRHTPSALKRAQMAREAADE